MNVITQFIAGLSSTGKKLFAIAFVIVAIALFDRLLISPTLSRMSAIDSDIEKETNSIKQDLRFLSYKDKINSESKVYAPYLSEKALSEEEIISAFLKSIEVLAKKGNVTVAKVTPSSGSKEKDYVKYVADLECSGVLSDVVTFIHLIDTSEELMKVVKFSFSSKKADSDEIKAVMTIHKVVISKRD